MRSAHKSLFPKRDGLSRKLIPTVVVIVVVVAQCCLKCKKEIMRYSCLQSTDRPALTMMIMMMVVKPSKYVRRHCFGPLGKGFENKRTVENEQSVMDAITLS